MTLKELRSKCRKIVTAKVKADKLTWRQGCQLFKALYEKMKVKVNQ